MENHHVESPLEKTIRLFREAYAASGLNVFYKGDMESDIRRFTQMPGEVFLVAATSSSSDALPVLVHEAAANYFRLVVEARKKNSASDPLRCFCIHPQSGSVEPMEPDEALAWLAKHPPAYRKEGQMIKSRDGESLGRLVIREERCARSDSMTLHYRYVPITKQLDADWLTMFMSCEMSKHGLGGSAVPEVDPAPVAKAA